MGRSNKARMGTARRRLCFETVESRRLMAVTTSLDANGNLRVIGDAAADVIAIFGTSNPGEFTIQGSGTTVDGGASATISGVTGDLTVELEGGSDVLNMDNVYLAGDLTIDDDRDGDDIVVFGETGVVSAAGNCRVSSSSGQDLFVARPYKAFFGGSLLIRDDGHNGAVSMVGASAADIAVLNIREISMQGVTSGGQIYIQAGSSAGTPHSSIIAILTSAANLGIRIDIPDGQNSVYIDTCYSAAGIVVDSYSKFFPSGGQMHVPGPAPYNNNDTITIARCQARTLSVDTAGPAPNAHLLHTGGDDSVSLYGNYLVGPAASSGSPVVNVKSGDGVDAVNASYNIVLGEMRVTLDQLDDTLGLVGNQVTVLMNADGGLGTNRLFSLGNQFAASSFSFFQ